MVVTVQDLTHFAESRYENAPLGSSQISTQELARLCAQEITHYRAGDLSDDRYARALFYRAIIRRDDEAWTCIYQQFTPLVLSWISNHPQATYILEYDNYDSIVNASFAKFSQAVTPAKFENFVSVAALLQYLKHCVRSVIIDSLRSQQSRPAEELLDLTELELTEDDPTERIIEQLALEDLWQVIRQTFKCEKERVCITLMYIYDLEPHEIQWRHRRLFPTVDEVYRVRQNVFARLRRNSALKAMWICSGG